MRHIRSISLPQMLAVTKKAALEGAAFDNNSSTP